MKKKPTPPESVMMGKPFPKWLQCVCWAALLTSFACTFVQWAVAMYLLIFETPQQ